MKKTEFDIKKSASLAHQLIKVGRLINERGLNEARKTFQIPDLKQSHLDLFPYIDFEGTSASEIAKRKGVSKQSVSKLVQEMVQMKLLTLKTDPEDSRSKRVFFKISGPQAIQNGFKALTAIDRLLIENLGEMPYKMVLKRASDIVDILHYEDKP